MCINSASLLSLIYFVFRLFLPHYGSHFLLLLSSNFLLCAGHYGWFVVKSWIWCLFCKEYWVFSSRQFILAVSLILLRPDLSLSGRCLVALLPRHGLSDVSTGCLGCSVRPLPSGCSELQCLLHCADLQNPLHPRSQLPSTCSLPALWNLGLHLCSLVLSQRFKGGSSMLISRAPLFWCPVL